MVRWSAAISLAMMLTVSTAWRAEAHSWYPHECCSNQDCMAADAVETDGLGGRSVLVGQVRVLIPHGTIPRPSPDGRAHVCFNTWAADLYGLPTFVVICLFLPASV
jgi:hypothetical protein